MDGLLQANLIFEESMELNIVVGWIKESIKDCGFDKKMTGKKPTKEYPYYKFILTKDGYTLTIQMAEDFRFISGHMKGKGSRDLCEFNECTAANVAYIIDDFMFEMGIM
jgi:hypothetical protein